MKTKTCLRSLLIALGFLFLISSTFCQAEDAQKDYRFGIVDNKSIFPVNVRVENENGDVTVEFLKSDGRIILPHGTKNLEVLYASTHPIGNEDAKLDVEVRRGNTTEKPGKIEGFYDKFTFEKPTGAFPPDYLNLKSDYEARVLPGAAYPEDEARLAINKLVNKNAEVREEGARYLGKIRCKEAVKPLSDIAANDKYPYIQKVAVRALGQIGGKESLPAIRKALRDDNSDLRSLAINALGGIGGEEDVDALAEAIKSSSFYERSSAVAALGNIGGDKARAVIKKALKDKNPFVRQRAVNALGHIGNADDTALVSGALKDKSAWVREAATHALSKMKGNAAKDGLLAAMGDEKNYVRSEAVHDIVKNKGDEALPIFREALKSDSPEARISAIEGMARINNNSSVDDLMKALGDSDPKVRARAAWALGQIGNAKAVDVLGKALTDDSTYVSSNAAHALGKIGGAKARASLENSLNDKSLKAKGEVREALDKLDILAKEKAQRTRKDEVKLRDKDLMELNDRYLEDKKRLKEIDPDSEEAQLRRDRMKNTEGELKGRVKAEENKYGPDWINKYRDESGKLPGGLLEDDKSTLLKAKEAREKQKEKVDGLQKKFDELKQQPRKPLEPLKNRLRKAEQDFMKKFVKEHGTSDQWDKKDHDAFIKGTDKAREKAQEQWEKEHKERSSLNRQLGKTIKSLVKEKSDLKQMDKDIKGLEGKVKKAGGTGEKAPAGGSRGGSGGAQDTSLAPGARQALSKWPPYDFKETPVQKPKSLSKKTYSLFDAMDEVGGMIKEVNAARAKHVNVFSSPRFMACYYVKRGGLPREELGRLLWKVDPSGKLQDPLWEWMANDFAGLTDMWNRPVVPGIAGNDGNLMHMDEIKHKLNTSLDYLKSRSQIYENNPPIKEMKQMRDLMNAWRGLIVEYHNGLDEYIAFISKFLVLRDYYETLVYNQKKEELDRRYVGREKNKVLMAKYEVELKNLDAWRAKIEAKVKEHWDAYDGVKGKVYQATGEVLPEALPEKFGTYDALRAANQEYMVKTERLRQVGKGSKEGKQLQEQMGSLKKQISGLMKDEQEKHGKNWKDRYRNSKTGGLPGGFLKDGPIARFKAWKRMKASAGGKKKKLTGEDKLYKFLKSCNVGKPSGKEVNVPKKKGNKNAAGGDPSEWGSSEGVIM